MGSAELGCVDAATVGVEVIATRDGNAATCVGGVKMLWVLLEELEVLVFVLKLEE